MEILKNTILKLIYRQGSNVDRKFIRFNSGEPAYTNDTERLYIGNGILSGGNPVSNFFLGTTTDITTFTNAEIGDTAFDNDKGKLYALDKTTASNLSSWENIGGVYTSGDSRVIINGSNQISLSGVAGTSRITARYNSALSSFTLSENITTSTRLSAGHYNFIYPPISEIQVPMVQTVNDLDIWVYPRTINNTLSSCDVVILSSNQVTVDKDFVLKIDY